MKIEIARHHGMCFGVRDALRKTHDLAQSQPVTVLGELVHNPLVQAHLSTLGVRHGDLDSPGEAPTEAVVITAHGASDARRREWREQGHAVYDTTCPLVRKAHRALECLVLAGYHPVVIGRRDHVEVRGLVGDFPEAVVVLEAADLEAIPADASRIGVISQTTQPLDRVEALVAVMRDRFPGAEVRLVDTVCQPTKDRQAALADLCARSDAIVVVGGRNSNNTAQLVETARRLGCRAWQVERPEEVEAGWFRRQDRVGVTAGTSTLDETVQAVVERLRQVAKEQESLGLFDALKAIA
ncbi:MAG: 4-hydroxy-3-methylbut-2-enyl diphosphate reductase [Verrucomicrobiales bacterium]|nr:4-hydroxy-3-methylbut-2-enyl diphosphate reductase [Verrucomicrobiales bacterium]